MSALSINAERLLSRIRALGEIGRDGDGRLTRLAGSDADKAGRDQLARWLREADLEIAVDRIGNIFGSHIDTVILRARCHPTPCR